MVLSYSNRLLISFCVSIVLLCSVGISVYVSFAKMARQMDTFNVVVAEMTGEEKRSLDASRDAVEDSTMVAMLAAGLGLLTCLVILSTTALANLHLQKALKEQAIRDPLTKLFNRRYLEETMVRECARAQRNKKKLSVLMMDIDHFKEVNDRYGHDAGDAVLVAFARLLSQKIRKEDIACRLGGEELVLILPDADLALAKMRGEEICEATRKMTVTFQKLTINVTVSIGVCMYPEHGEVPEELIHHADLCLYKAKREGRDRVIAYDESIGVEDV